MKKDNATEV